MLIEGRGGVVLVEPANGPNLKVTTPADLAVAAALLRWPRPRASCPHPIERPWRSQARVDYRRDLGRARKSVGASPVSANRLWLRYAGGASANCGASPPISCQSALYATWRWKAGSISSSRMSPAATKNLPPRSSYRLDPHVLQKLRGANSTLVGRDQVLALGELEVVLSDNHAGKARASPPLTARAVAIAHRLRVLNLVLHATA